MFFEEIGLECNELVEGEYSKVTIQDFYSVCIRLYNSLGKDFFRRINFSGNLLKDKKLNGILRFLISVEKLMNTTVISSDLSKHELVDSLVDTLISWLTDSINLSNIVGKTGNDIGNIFEGITSNISKSNNDCVNINDSNIELLINNIDYLFLVWFNEIFQIKGESITNKQIEQLEGKWGDLDVLYTLISRYYGNMSWIKEIPLFSRVVECVLEGKFKKLKYEGYNGDEEDCDSCIEQLGLLEGDELNNWINNISSLRIVNKKEEGKLTDDEILKVVQGEFLEQLIRQKHLDKISKGLSEEIGNLKIDDFDQEEIGIIRESKNLKEIENNLQGTKTQKRR